MKMGCRPKTPVSKAMQSTKPQSVEAKRLKLSAQGPTRLPYIFATEFSSKPPQRHR